MTKQIVWTYRKFFFLQFDTKFASKHQRLAKIGNVLWLLLSANLTCYGQDIVELTNIGMNLVDGSRV